MAKLVRDDGSELTLESTYANAMALPDLDWDLMAPPMPKYTGPAKPQKPAPKKKGGKK
jgi:hypothetical protein